MPSGVEVPLARHPTAAREARRLLRDQFSDQLDQEDTDTAKVLLSELVNNAVVHGQGQITLKLHLDANRLRIEVIDEGEGFAYDAQRSGFRAVGGRGLKIVDAAASRWGIFEGTTHVWFELELSRPRLGPE